MSARILHIFRKDLRRLWPYVFGLWAITGCGVALDATFYDKFDWRGRDLLSMIPLMEWVACWLVVAVLIQQEPPVGNARYWLVRPIAWQELLCAKALFIVTALVPVWICHRVLWFAGELPSQASFTAALILPAVAYAAVTSNLGEAVLAFFGTVAALMMLSPAALIRRSGPPLLLEAAVSLAVILLQYSSRRENLARSILLAGAVALVVLARF